MHAGSNPQVFGFEIHRAALTSLSRVPGKGNKKARGDASVARSVGIGVKSGERGTLMAVTSGL